MMTSCLVKEAYCIKFESFLERMNVELGAHKNFPEALHSQELKLPWILGQKTFSLLSQEFVFPL